MVAGPSLVAAGTSGGVHCGVSDVPPLQERSSIIFPLSECAYPVCGIKILGSAASDAINKHQNPKARHLLLQQNREEPILPIPWSEIIWTRDVSNSIEYSLSRDLLQ